MKFFYKIFLFFAGILTLALSIVTCVTLQFHMDTALERELRSAVTQHRMVEYAIECSMLSVSNQYTLTNQRLAALTAQSASMLEDSDCYALTTADGQLIAGTVTALGCSDSSAPGALTYAVSQEDSGLKISICSRFTQGGSDLTLHTVRDISGLLTDAHALLKQEQRIFLSVMGGSFLVVLAAAWLLTMPIRELRRASEDFAQGNYTSRARVQSRDEFRALAGSYNQMADALEQKILDLEEAARQKEDFVANFAHELKTPMTSIIGYADTIYQKALSPEELRHAAGYIVSEGMRLEALSFKLLDLIALGREDYLLEETELEPFFQEILESSQPIAQKREVAFSMDCANGWVRMECDLMKTMVMNLIDNAMKSGATQVRLTGHPVGGSYCLRVTDNGRGIPEEELGRITEAFYMVDKSRSRREHGAGLGLALAARIAHIHHTKLEFASVPGAGTEVTVRLAMEGGEPYEDEA